MADLQSFVLQEGEILLARRKMGHIFLTNQRVISGPQQWMLENISCIHGAFTIGTRERRDMIESERMSRDGRISLFILISLSLGALLMSAIWFILWMINKAFKVKHVPMMAYQLVIISGGEKALVLEDYRRREVKRLGLALVYARRMRFRELRQLKAQADAGNVMPEDVS